MTIFSVSPKISDSKNAKIIFITVKYVCYIYRILSDGSKVTENTEGKCENCLSRIFSILTAYNDPKKIFHHKLYTVSFFGVSQVQNVILFIKFGLKLSEL